MDRRTIGLLKQSISQAVIYLIATLNSMETERQDAMREKIKRWLQLTKEICIDSNALTESELSVIERLFNEVDWTGES